MSRRADATPWWAPASAIGGGLLLMALGHWLRAVDGGLADMGGES